MEELTRLIHASGGRLTPTKKGIVSVLLESGCLKSREEILEGLRGLNLRPDRSTIFRELNFLIAAGVIRKIAIEKDEFYELLCNRQQHLVCLSCKKIEHVELDSAALETKLEREKHFLVCRGMLQIYGYCFQCRQRIGNEE